jgi:hypothetical protein
MSRLTYQAFRVIGERYTVIAWLVKSGYGQEVDQGFTR